ncbi:MAG: tRNA pseudouridine(55) synthase TruB [Burkholderiaceae bacterium]|jgi:tRNA pseudouridine55 synthase|nr:tRNA pseudouridine(55) synthase TruB [Burkholderiaceae bacterium]
MTATPRARVQRRPVHGVLLLDKPLGLSSNQALQKAKWLLRAEKAGHTGTLDPLATGVLPLCFGAATKFSQGQLEAGKSYAATLCLGVSTTTGDAEGDVVARRPVPPMDAGALEAVRQRFLGRISQLPPMHSALKKDGKPLYAYARDGVEVERTPRQVQIDELKMAPAQAGGTWEAIDLILKCSKGTYVRTLGEDIGAALGCGGHLTHLRRIGTGPFGIEQCVTLEALEAMSEGERLARLLPVESLVAEHAHIVLDEQDAGRFLSGLRRRGAWADAPAVAVFAPSPLPREEGGEQNRGKEPFIFLGTAHVQSGELIPERLLNPVEIQQILQQNF